MSIYCIGQAAYDITFPLNDSMIENQKYRVYDKFECIGAPATNAAYLCALWGADTTLFARMGSDSYGREIKQVLEDVHVNTDYLMMCDHLKTPLSCIIANKNNGFRTILNYPGILESIKFDFPKESPDVMLMDGHELEASLQALKQYPNAISLIDAGTARKSTLQLASKVDYLVCSQDFAYQYTGIEVDITKRESWIQTFYELKELNQNHIVVTLGSDGLLYEDDGDIKHLPAYQRDAIDTTGAGDIFHGAFAYCLSKDLPLLDTLKICSMTASISTEKLGGQSSIPSKEVVNEHLKEAKEQIIII